MGGTAAGTTARPGIAGGAAAGSAAARSRTARASAASGGRGPALSRGARRAVAMGRPRALAGPALTGRTAARGGGAAAVGTRTPLVTPPRDRAATGARRGPAGPRGTGLAGARAAMCVVVLRAASCHAADFTGAPARAPARPAARAHRTPGEGRGNGRGRSSWQGGAGGRRAAAPPRGSRQGTARRPRRRQAAAPPLGESPGRAAGASSHPVSPAETRPWGSRFGDVTWARIAPGGLARIELRWIMSRWARTARGEADCVALGSHCASRARPPWAGRPGSGPRRSGSYRPTPSRSRLRFVVPGREDLRVKAGDAVLMAVSDGLRRDDGAEKGGRCVSLTPRFRGRSPWNGAMTPFPG